VASRGCRKKRKIIKQKFLESRVKSIQRVYRGHRGRLIAQQKRRERDAIRLQMKQIQCAIKIQALCRGVQCRREWVEELARRRQWKYQLDKFLRTKVMRSIREKTDLDYIYKHVVVPFAGPDSPPPAHRQRGNAVYFTSFVIGDEKRMERVRVAAVRVQMAWRIYRAKKLLRNLKHNKLLRAAN